MGESPMPAHFICFHSAHEPGGGTIATPCSVGNEKSGAPLPGVGQGVKKMPKEWIGMSASEPMEYIEVALALETLAYHNKNYLCHELCDNKNFSEEIQWLLHRALDMKEKR